MSTLQPEGAQIRRGGSKELNLNDFNSLLLRDAQNPPSTILHSVLCTGSHFNIKGEWGTCCQVNTCPAGMCAAGTAGVGFHFFSPPTLDSASIFVSFIFSLPPTHLLYLPKRAQIQLPPGSCGRQPRQRRVQLKEEF